MITEDYISFGLSKLLKEKGFDGECDYLYVDGELVRAHGCACNWNKGETLFADYKNECSAPTLQMVTKWLREVHNLHCSVDYDYVLGWYCQITSLKETVEYDYEEMKHYHPDKDNDFSSPEEACEAGIKFCLENLI